MCDNRPVIEKSENATATHERRKSDAKQKCHKIRMGLVSRIVFRKSAKNQNERSSADNPLQCAAMIDNWNERLTWRRIGWNSLKAGRG